MSHDRSPGCIWIGIEIGARELEIDIQVHAAREVPGRSSI